MKKFNISINIHATLDLDQLWPDGDAPESPTVQDVRDLIDDCGGLDIIEDWALGSDFDIEVSEAGKPPEFPRL